MNKTIYEDMPRDMRAYLSNYGWHFNKAMQEWAASRMRERSGNPIKPYTKESLEGMLKAYAIQLKTEHIYDALYVANMCKADFLGSSIADEAHLAKYVADYISDPDGYEGMPFVRFYADTCMQEDTTIYWEDML
jgi:hypothetical protein